MKKFKYVIIDDEYPSHLTVRQYFKAYTNYACAATFFDPEKALLFLQEHEIDLIFLDIEMPEMNGFQFLEALKKNIFLVIHTAYPEKYSLDAHKYYEKDLVFFSNKAQFSYYFPKIIARFEKLHVEKEIIDRINQLFKNEIHTFPKVFNNKPIPLVDILMITVIGHNIVLKMKNGEEIIFRMSLRELTSFLPANNFLQIQRSVIINVLYVTAFTDTTVCINEKHLHISTRKQNGIVQILKAEKQELYKKLLIKTT